MSDSSNPSLPAAPSATLAPRWLGAATLRAATFEQVDRDPHALAQAALIVLAGGVARGVGVFPHEGWIGLVGGTAVGFLMWIVAAALVWALGVLWLERASGFPELLRTLGFAAAPLVALAACAALPPDAARIVAAVVHAWATLAFAFAVRAALAVSMPRAFAIAAAALFGALLLLLGAAAFLFDNALID